MCWLLAVAPLAAATAFAAPSEFQAGVAAAKRGEYEQAARHFERAREEGLDTPALHHNLGVAYYRTARYEAARQSFLRAARAPEMRALSHYNLGLVARREGNEEAAERWFRAAHEGARTERLRRLAATQLGLSDPTRRYRAYLEGFGGYDSNPGLVSDDAGALAGEREEGDAAFGALAAGEMLLAGDWRSGLKAKASGYGNFHPDLDEEDIGSLTGGFGVHASHGAWRHELDLVANQLWLGRDPLETGGRVGLRSIRRWSGTLAGELRLRSHYIEGSGDFDYLSGWRHTARARLLGRCGDWSWKAGYEFVHEDRDDLRIETDAGTDFFSVSPLRHEASVSLERPLVWEVSGVMEVAYRRSEYRDAEIRSDMESGRRRDDRWAVLGGLSRPLWGDWVGRVESTYWNNRSSCSAGACDRFDYGRVDVLVSVGRSF